MESNRIASSNTSDSEFPFACDGLVQINLARQSQEPKLNHTSSTVTASLKVQSTTIMYLVLYYSSQSLFFLLSAPQPCPWSIDRGCVGRNNYERTVLNGANARLIQKTDF